MRRHAEWMVIADERILEFLRENSARQPKQITVELNQRGLDYNDKYIGQRCLKLADRGLIRNLGNGIYTITDTGKQYLEGEIHVGEID